VNPRRCFVGRAEPADLEALLAIERLCSPHPWSECMFASALSGAAGQCVLVARTCLELAAFCACAYVVDEVHIHNVATHPDRRREGLGRLLLSTALSVGWRAGGRCAHLEVRASNAGARALYTRMGFREAGTRRDYYAAPREDAVLMSRVLESGNPDQALPF
jgi:ribosomal-protein-alanine N-acetyltransferase